jgi:universal stress protein A
MKIKPTPKTGGVVLKLGPDETQIPTQAPASVFRIKRILVPLDFSDCSTKALEYALPFAKQFGAELKLLHVTEVYTPGPELGFVETEDLQAKANLDRICSTVKGSVACSWSMRTGAPAGEIVEAARELGIDLIIISTHGRKGLTRMFLGSTTETVVRHAPCPVLVVRETEREFVSEHSDSTN